MASGSRRSAAPSILSIDLKIEGDVVSDGEVHVIGAIKGDVVARKLTIGDGGSITGTVEAETVVIAGNLTGRLTATAVTFARTARVVADVTYVSLTIEPGAMYEGYSRRVETIEAVTDDGKRMEPRRLGTQHLPDGRSA